MGKIQFTSKDKKKILGLIQDQKFLISEDRKNKLVDLFIKELKLALDNKKSSLSILPGFVKSTSRIRKRDNIAVIEAGKINLRKGMLNFEDDGVVVREVMNYPMPGSFTNLTKDQFINKIIFETRDVLRSTNTVGFCFCHQIQYDQEGTARLKSWSRNKVLVPQLINIDLIKEFKDYLKKEFSKKYSVFVVNDTIATLIAGLSDTNRKEYEDFIGIVYGEGYNLAYLEKTSKLQNFIPASVSKKDDMAVNLQAGSFSKVKESKPDKEVKKLLKKIQVGDFSRKINIKSLPLIFKTLVESIPDSLINPKIKKFISEIEDLSLEDMNNFLTKGLKGNTRLSGLVKYAYYYRCYIQLHQWVYTYYA